MLFNTLRIVLWLIVSIFIILKIRTTKIVRKKLVSILAVVLCMGLISVSGMFPVENLFINFKSPESVFDYASSGKIDDIVYGKESCMVISSKGNNVGGHLIIPKSEKGYKIPNCFVIKKVSHKFDQDGYFDIYNVLGTNDYYIFGTTISKESELTIVDSNNKLIKNIIIETGSTDIKTVLFYSFVENFTNEYYLLINGEKITLNSMQVH